MVLSTEINTYRRLALPAGVFNHSTARFALNTFAIIVENDKLFELFVLLMVQITRNILLVSEQC